MGNLRYANPNGTFFLFTLTVYAVIIVEKYCDHAAAEVILSVCFHRIRRHTVYDTAGFSRVSHRKSPETYHFIFIVILNAW